MGTSRAASPLSNSPEEVPWLYLISLDMGPSLNQVQWPEDAMSSSQAKASAYMWSQLWSQYIPNLTWSKGREESLQRKSGDSELVDRGVGAGKHINCPLHILEKTCGGLLYLEAKSAYCVPKHDVQHCTLKSVDSNLIKIPSTFWHFICRNTEA